MVGRGRRAPNRGPSQVSQNAAKRARTDGRVAYHARPGVGWQKGERAEKMVLEDALLGTKGKKLVVFCDMFAAVGDRLLAWYSLFRDRAQQPPLTFYFAVEPREHFYRIAHIRLTTQAAADFNAARLDCPGFAPLPELRV